jgi:hypothetical protein
MTDIAARTDPPPVVMVRDEPDLCRVIRERCAELQITYNTLDAAALLPDGYSSKVLAEHPTKHMGALTLWSVLGTLGYRIGLVHDEELLARFRDKLVVRKRPPQASGRPPPVKYTLTRQFLKKIGRLGAAKSHAVASKKRHISEVNRANALKRWHKLQISEG